MKISYLSASLMPSTDANCVNVTRMCAALAALGHEVTLLARRGGEDSDERVLLRHDIGAGVRLVRLGHPGRPLDRLIGYPCAVRRALLAQPTPDLLFGRDLYSMMLAAQAMPDVALAFDMHDLQRKHLRRRAELWLFRRPAFQTVFAVSQALIDQYRALNPGAADVDIALARNGADLPEDAVQPAQLPAGRPGVPRVGYIGHLYPGKGMETVAALAARLPCHDFHVVGGREQELALWRGRAAGLPNLILHGFVDHRLVRAYMAAMDVLLAPPLPVARCASGKDIGSWMSPLKIFEYMAAARPIIASDMPVVREILRDGETALLVPPLDVAAWVAALRRLEGDPELAARLGRQALAQVRERHTWNARARGVLDHLAGRAPPAPRAEAAAA
jgi:glycosyltransferase involved in cell wall biosynthesis